MNRNGGQKGSGFLQAITRDFRLGQFIFFSPWTLIDSEKGGSRTRPTGAFHHFAYPRPTPLAQSTAHEQSRTHYLDGTIRDRPRGLYIINLLTGLFRTGEEMRNSDFGMRNSLGERKKNFLTNLRIFQRPENMVGKPTLQNSSGRDLDKFEAFRLTPMPARRVAPPLVADCLANLECRVTDTRFVTQYNLFILEVVKAWIDPAKKNAKTIHHRGCGTFTVDGKTIRLKSRMA